MDPIQPIGPRISNIPAVERVGHRIDPEQQKREQQKKDQQRRQREQPEEPDEDDGLPHIDVCC
ncbi:MAG TPA: hypothetical protein VH256_04580 [Thermoleophilaceae bacterium]|jgi:hypothetical protein|nr:hypothetical protein [Thermoleophilaceae bacterium]